MGEASGHVANVEVFVIHADEIPSAIETWPRYQILWQDHHERTVIRARTQLEAEGIARKFAVTGGWVVWRVQQLETAVRGEPSA